MLAARRSRAASLGALPLALAIALVAACSRDQPAAPRPHSISGHVKLTGHLVDENALPAGTKVVGDADGVAVDLVYGDHVIRHTTTVDGVYRFDGLPQGGYVARASVNGQVLDETLPLTIGDFDVAAADTLRLAAHGDLYPVPNPYVTSTQIFYAIPDTEFVEIEIVDLAGNPVRTLVRGERVMGLRIVMWDGRDEDGQNARDAIYWVTFVSGDDVRAQLLFRAPPPPPGAP